VEIFWRSTALAIFTPSEIAEQKAAWKAALMAVSTGQSYEVGGRSLTRADLPEIRKTLEWLDQQESVAAGNAGPQFVSGRVAR
jgi:hypothetical protein